MRKKSTTPDTVTKEDEVIGAFDALQMRQILLIVDTLLTLK